MDHKEIEAEIAWLTEALGDKGYVKGFADARVRPAGWYVGLYSEPFSCIAITTTNGLPLHEALLEIWKRLDELPTADPLANIKAKLDKAQAEYDAAKAEVEVRSGVVIGGPIRGGKIGGRAVYGSVFIGGESL